MSSFEGVLAIVVVSSVGCVGSEARTTREQLADPAAAGVSFEAVPDRSTVVLTWALTGPGLDRDVWIPVPIDRGTAAIHAPGDTLEVGLAIMLDDLPLVAGDGALPAIELAGLRLWFTPDGSCTASWDDADDAARGSCVLQVSLEWDLRVDGLTVALPSPTLAPAPVMVQVDREDDALVAHLGAAVPALDWSFAGFAARGTLVFGFEGTAPAE